MTSPRAEMSYFSLPPRMMAPRTFQVTLGLGSPLTSHIRVKAGVPSATVCTSFSESNDIGSADEIRKIVMNKGLRP